MISAVIFDVDGTLVDDNESHVEAWVRAFQQLGYDISADRIRVEVGKGGDNLVPSIIGKDADERDGDRIRELHGAAFEEIASKRHFRLFPGALELMAALRARGTKTALATSSKKKHIDLIMKRVGIDLREKVDVVATGDDAEESKPAPDIVHVALKKLDLAGHKCVMIGDTPYDGEAAHKTDVEFIGLLCGGENDERTLRDAGAMSVWRDPADLLAHLEQAIDLAEPATAR